MLSKIKKKKTTYFHKLGFRWGATGIDKNAYGMNIYINVIKTVFWLVKLYNFTS
jgi:hypothetical protein